MRQPPNVIPSNDLERRLRMYLLDKVVQDAEKRTPEMRYASIEDLVWNEGEFWTPFKSPFPWRPDRDGYCYYYTLRLVLDMAPALRYVEGFALHLRLREAIPHAWAVDEQRRVWDSTWANPELGAYFGMVIPVADVVKFWNMDEEYVGVLQRQHLIGDPMLRYGELFPRLPKGQ